MTDELKNDIAVNKGSGEYILTYEMTSGTAALTYSIDGGKNYINVPSSSQTSSTGVKVTLPNCKLKSVITGDATLNINKAD
jgi:hypothetical protein